MKNMIESLDGDMLSVFEVPSRLKAIDVKGLGTKRINSLHENLQQWNLTEADDRLTEKSVGIISAADAVYPDCLWEIYDPPPVLFYRGELDTLDSPRIAIVGTRKSTQFGNEFAQQLARDLADVGVTVVSGLASGIDAASHRGALNSGDQSTVAVLGNGVDITYPRRNRELQEEIEQTELLVSEYSPGTKPDGRHFPERNRIISGLSSAVIVVQAGIRSGAIITADCALEQGREVYAVPGNVDDDLHKGCHRLIKEGAALVESAEDVIDYLQVEGSFRPEEQVVELNPEAKKLLNNIESRPIHLDELAQLTGLEHGTCSKHLLALEDKGLIIGLPGQRYQRSPDAKQVTIETTC